MKHNFFEIIEDSSLDTETSARPIDLNSLKEPLISSHFSKQEKFLRRIFNLDTENVSESRQTDTKLIFSTERKEDLTTQSSSSDRYYILEPWKNIENVSARLIEYSDLHVLLECLIDKELGKYEERLFSKSLFSNYQLFEGKLFYLRFFERKNEIKLQVHDDLGLTLEKDFPKKSLAEKYKNSRIFK